MNPPCAKCSKTVYPTEKLNCLDKTWHKACFECSTCGLTLNVKTYKGYDKLPYCNTHYPTTEFTAVSDTPEGKRTPENTTKPANVGYEPRQQHYPPPQQPPPQRYQPPPQSYQPPSAAASAVYIAMYDYVAADGDEVSFNEGDTIENVEIIDESWMTGTVKRTTKHGMFPSNYAERV